MVYNDIIKVRRTKCKLPPRNSSQVTGFTESTLRLMMKHQEALLKVNPEECKLYFDADDKFITEYEDGDKEIAIPIRTPENIKLWPMTFIGSGWMWYESNEQGEEV